MVWDGLMILGMFVVLVCCARYYRRRELMKFAAGSERRKAKDHGRILEWKPEDFEKASIYMPCYSDPSKISRFGGDDGELGICDQRNDSSGIARVLNIRDAKTGKVLK